MLRHQLCRWQAVRKRVHCRGGRLHPHRHWQSAVLRQMTHLSLKAVATDLNLHWTSCLRRAPSSMQAAQAQVAPAPSLPSCDPELDCDRLQGGHSCSAPAPSLALGLSLGAWQAATRVHGLRAASVPTAAPAIREPRPPARLRSRHPSECCVAFPKGPARPWQPLRWQADARERRCAGNTSAVRPPYLGSTAAAALSTQPSQGLRPAVL